MKHVKLNVLQLLQLRLHPQSVCLVLELSSVMEDLKKYLDQKERFRPIRTILRFALPAVF